MEVTCFFAVSASASSCVVAFDNSSFEWSFNGTIQRSLDFPLSSTGFVDIPQEISQREDLSIVAFDARVYDAEENGTIISSPAFEQKRALVIQNVPEETSANMAAGFTGEKA